MSNLLSGECRQLLDQLEVLPVQPIGELTPAGLLARLPFASQEHARACPACAKALEDLAATRVLLHPLAESDPWPGPWFAARVMAAIRAKQRELEERRDGVWLSIRRLAPRLVALCALLLAFGGTWAFQLRRSDLMRQEDQKSVEAVFQTSAQGTPFDDDVLAPAREGRR